MTFSTIVYEWRGDDVDKHLMRPQLTTHHGVTMLLDGITNESSLRHEQQLHHYLRDIDNQHDYTKYRK
jgi:hypothetical protein